MPNYYEKHPEDFANRLHQIPYTLEEIKQFNEAPTTLANVGVVVYFSNKACEILIQEMKNVHWNVFYQDPVGGYPFTIEDVGIAFALDKNKIYATYYPMFSDNYTSIEDPKDTIAHHL
jgi:hypothetical protein